MQTEARANADNYVKTVSKDTELGQKVAGRRAPWLRSLVFVAGATVMAVEMCASRLIQPSFGNSLLIWASLIGLVMIFLSLGYFLGGKLADRSPQPRTLYRLTAMAAIVIGLIPVLDLPVLNGVSVATKNLSGGLFWSSVVSILVLFSLPVVLLGCVTPFAVRLQVLERSNAGKTAGGVSSLSTLGSIVGTFLPVLFLIPNLGVRATMYLFAAILLLVSLVGWFLARNYQSALSTQQPARTNNNKIIEVKTPKNLLYAIVLLCGVAVMAVEMCASRLIQPYFGDSLLIWANLIGFVMVYLTIGYFVGGKLADRYPNPAFLYQLTGWAAFTTGLIPILSDPIFGLAKIGFDKVDGGLFYGSLVGIVLLFSVPLLLLGCVTPFAVRLRIVEAGNAGKTAGTISSLSTLGSIAGTFLPVLVLIPATGTRTTLYIFASVLLLASLVGLVLTGGPRLRLRLPIYAGMLVVVLVLAFGFVIKTIKPSNEGTLIYEKESAINYIQVVQSGDNTLLVLNEGHAIHSLYNPKQILTGGYWDYYMLAPFFAPNVQQSQVKNSLMVGLAAGTVPRILSGAYGDQLKIDGVEIDPEIVKVGRDYFHMNDQPNLTPITEDGRYYLVGTDKKYDLVGIDAFHQPYIPFYLTTQEFFRQVRDHLNTNGVTAINVGSPAASNGQRDFRLVNAIASTMRSVFPSVFIVDVPGTFNSVVVATNQTSDSATLAHNLDSNAVSSPLIKQVGDNVLKGGNLREWTQTQTIFTDDKAPVEQLIDQIILDYVVGGGK